MPAQICNRGYWFSNLHVALVLSTLFQISLDVARGYQENGFEFLVENNEATIASYTGPDGALAIPEKLNGIPVTRIGAGAFSFHTGLTSLTLPNSVISIGENAFFPCPALASILADPSNPAYASVNGVLMDKSQSVLVRYPPSKAGDYRIPNSVTSIAGHAFFGCHAMSSVSIPASVATIGFGAFYRCSGLTNVLIEPGLKSIERAAFADCIEMTKLTLPRSVTFIGTSAFMGTTALISIDVDADNPAYASADGVLMNKSQSEILQYPPGKIGAYTIPSGVSSVGESAFGGCKGLTSVTIPGTMASLGIAAFTGCTSLESIMILNGLKTIGDEVFPHCTALKSVTIPASVTAIGYGAFFGCTGSPSIFFEGDAPRLLDRSAFEESNAVIYYLPGTAGWSQIFDTRPTSPWELPYPLILKQSTNYGAKGNEYGFLISWATDLSVIVESSPSLTEPVWIPTKTNALTNGQSVFTDATWTNGATRFYRVRSK